MNDGAQPAFRANGQRLVYRNLRSGMGGLTAIDPATGLILRFTEYPKTASQPGMHLAAALPLPATEKGIAVGGSLQWADVDGAVDTLGFG